MVELLFGKCSLRTIIGLGLDQVSVLLCYVCNIFNNGTLSVNG